jgi:hypothetical protein
MKYHCGLLDERPDKSKMFQWITRWNWDSLPDDVATELKIWLAMPGFTTGFHVATLGRHVRTIEAYRPAMADFSKEVAENWLSATREDCIRISQMRPGKGPIPIISQVRILEDLKMGRTQMQVVKDFRTSRGQIHKLLTQGITSQAGWPSGVPLP